MRGARRASLAAAVIALALFIAGPVFAVPRVTEVGWWSRQPGATAPQGGFAVATTPDGPTSVAAVRLELEFGIEVPILTAKESTLRGSVSTLRVCPTGDAWTPASPGTFDKAPKAACDVASADLVRQADGNWRADVGPLLRGRTGTVAVMIVPTAAASSGIPISPSIFEVQFSAPKLEGSAKPAPTTTTVSATTTTSAAPPPVTTATPRPTTGPAPATTAAARPATPQTVTTTRPPTTIAPTTTSRAVAAPTATQPVAVAPRTAVPSPADEGGPGIARALIFTAVALIAGVAAGLGRAFLR